MTVIQSAWVWQHLATDLLSGVWASRLCKAGACTAKTVELKNSERSERSEQLWTWPLSAI